MEVEWISVSESLPRPNDGVYWTTDGKKVELGRHMGANVWSSALRVTHWAYVEKPEPPK